MIYYNETDFGRDKTLRVVDESREDWQRLKEVIRKAGFELREFTLAESYRKVDIS